MSKPTLATTRPQTTRPNHGWLHRQLGSMAEFVVVTPALLLLGLGGFQGVMAYNAKTVLDYAVFEAARKGAVTHAQIEPMREEMGLRLAPVYGGDGSPEKAIAAITRSVLDTTDPRYTKIEVLNPTQEAFEDFGQTPLGSDRKEIPNTQLPYLSKTPGASSGVSIQDANLLKIRVTYGYRLTVPLISDAVTALLSVLHPENAAYYAVNRIPIQAVATVRMQSEARAANNASVKDGEGGGAPPKPEEEPGDGAPPDTPADDPDNPETPDEADGGPDRVDDDTPGTPTDPLPPIDPNAGGPSCAPRAAGSGDSGTGDGDAATGDGLFSAVQATPRPASYRWPPNPRPCPAPTRATRSTSSPAINTRRRPIYPPCRVYWGCALYATTTAAVKARAPTACWAMAGRTASASGCTRPTPVTN